MATQGIRLFGDPVLVTPASLVRDFDKELQILVADLIDTMVESSGAGLAAPQIGVPLRVFTWFVDDQFGHLVNPTLTLSKELQEGDEGCLSFPEIRYETPRSMRAVAEGFNMYGEPITIDGTEFLARALQHETDHLDGIVFIDRLSKSDRKAAMKEIRNAEWFSAATEQGLNPVIKVSPHSLFGRGV